MKSSVACSLFTERMVYSSWSEKLCCGLEEASCFCFGVGGRWYSASDGSARRSLVDDVKSVRKEAPIHHTTTETKGPSCHGQKVYSQR
jgi:hypothetical protein